LFTDGSKSDKWVSVAVVCQETEILIRLPNDCSVYTAEAQAIIQAHNLIKNKSIQKVIIFSDSLSTFRIIQNSYKPNDSARKIQNQIYKLQKENFNM
jgi:ribonuclease HI